MSAKAEPWAVDVGNDFSFKMDGIVMTRHDGCRFLTDPINNCLECIECNDDKWRITGEQSLQEAIEEHTNEFHHSLIPLRSLSRATIPGVFTFSLDGHRMFHYHRWRFLVNSVENMIQCLTCRENCWFVFGDRNLLKVMEGHVGKHHRRVIYLAQVTTFVLSNFETPPDNPLIPAKDNI